MVSRLSSETPISLNRLLEADLFFLLRYVTVIVTVYFFTWSGLEANSSSQTKITIKVVEMCRLVKLSFNFTATLRNFSDGNNVLEVAFTR